MTVGKSSPVSGRKPKARRSKSTADSNPYRRPKKSKEGNTEHAPSSNASPSTPKSPSAKRRARRRSRQAEAAMDWLPPQPPAALPPKAVTLSAQELEKAHALTSQKLSQWSAAAAALHATRAKTAPQTPVKFALDSWQEDAVNALLGGANVIVDAPTTAGKTKVVEVFIDEHIGNAGFRACYTCPVKSLSNDKLREFREKYGKEAVGIATGDIKENLDAPLVIATLESYRNSLLGVEPDLGRNLVIFDEYHFLQDESRGSAWEEALILTPAQCQTLLLSASLSNAREFADWLEQLTDRPSVLIEVTHRPVPLVDMVWFQGQWLLAESLPSSVLPKKKNPFLEPVALKELVAPLVALVPLGLSPCIVYAGKRLSCDLIAQALCQSLEPLERDKREQIGKLLMQADVEYKALSFIKPALRKMIQVYGVAFHHSGLAPLARLLIESLVKEGHLRFCVATMGLSLGINFSVKSTVISDAVRPGEFGFTPYSPSEVLQMTGRAGRRGKDQVGFSCWLNLNYLKRFSSTSRDSCDSRLRNDPTTFLGLISRGFSLGKVEQFYRKSFRNFQQPQANVDLFQASRVAQKLGSPLPCDSPAHEISKYRTFQNALCYDCPLRPNCHKFVAQFKHSTLAQLHLHLHQIGALSNEDKLSPLGELARYFPQSGGFLIAQMIEREELTTGNIMAATELMAALTMARFKTPQIAPGYRLPFAAAQIEEDLRHLYPTKLFPEMYESPRGRRSEGATLIREFNPLAGGVVHQWMAGCSWQELLEQVTSPQFGPGDVTGLLYRTASYLQSLIQAPCGELSKVAKEVRGELLRDPLQIVL